MQNFFERQFVDYMIREIIEQVKQEWETRCLFEFHQREERFLNWRGIFFGWKDKRLEIFREFRAFSEETETLKEKP